nr:MAG TPA: rhamnogalacturonase A [Caudoviricetes sp.]
MSMENLGPYTNFHELNQDWFLNEFNKLVEQWKAMQKNFDNLQDAFNDLKSYVQDYFKNLDVQDEINNKLNDMFNKGLLDKYFVYTINVKLYGVKENVDCSEQLQALINSVPSNTSLIFPQGNYIFGNIDITKNITLDFNNSIVTINKNYGISINGSTTPFSIGSLVRNGKLTGHNGELVNIINKQTLFNSSRDYYYLGGLFLIENDNFIPSLPFDIDGYGTEAYSITPVTCEIKNISNLTIINGDYFVKANYCRDLYFHDIKINTNCISCFQLTRCYNSILERITGTVHTGRNVDYQYAISANSCTLTIVNECDLLSKWHSFSGGGQECCMYNIIKNSSLISEGDNEGIDFHENCIYNHIENCLSTGIHICNDTRVENCDLSGRIYIDCADMQYKYLCNIYIDNCNDRTVTFRNVSKFINNLYIKNAVVIYNSITSIDNAVFDGCECNFNNGKAKINVCKILNTNKTTNLTNCSTVIIENCDITLNTISDKVIGYNSILSFVKSVNGIFTNCKLNNAIENSNIKVNNCEVKISTTQIRTITITGFSGDVIYANKNNKNYAGTFNGTEFTFTEI